MLEQALKKAIPNQLKNFEKLIGGHDPYHFTTWDKKDGASILRYWFWDKTETKKNHKRVFVNEIEELLKYLLRAQRFTRADYDKYCPRTRSDGTCGFAVIVRVLEYFQIIDIADGEYRVKSAEKIHELLSNQ